jgi:hypothetical protein
MTREHVKAMLPIIQAFAEGKKIQFRLHNTRPWGDTNEQIGLSFTYLPDQYRIKPEPKLVPFTYDDHSLFSGRWIKPRTGRGDTAYLITNYSNVGVLAGGMDTRWKGLLVDYVFIDNTPCGKLIEQ